MNTENQIRAEDTAWGSPLGYGACALAGCLWGTGFYWGKIVLAEMSVEYMVLFRFWCASLVLLPLAIRNPPKLDASEWRRLLLASLLGIPLQFLVQFYGLSLTTVSHASLMVGSMPIILAAGAVLFAGEHMDGIGWGALFVATIGTALIVLGGQHAKGVPATSLWGDLLVVASLVIATFWVLINQKLMKSHPPVVITAYGVISGTVMLSAWVLLKHTSLPPMSGISSHSWIALAISGVFCTASTTLLWNWGIHRVPASRAGVFINVEPALGSFLGVVLLGEHLGPHAFLGGAMIIVAAVVLTMRTPQRDGILE